MKSIVWALSDGAGLPDVERLLHLGRRPEGDVTRLVGLDRARPGVERRDGRARDCADRRARLGDCDRHGQAGRGGRRDRVCGRARDRARGWCGDEAHRLGGAVDEERLVSSRRSQIEVVSELVREDDARALADERDDGAADRADAGTARGGAEADGETGARGRGDGVDRAADDRERRSRGGEGDRLVGGGRGCRDDARRTAARGAHARSRRCPAARPRPCKYRHRSARPTSRRPCRRCRCPRRRPS